MPQFDSFEERVRAVATTKVIYKNGILKRIVAYNNGAKLITENLLFDPYTGAPLLTTTTNEFEQPIYKYTQPAYWFYPNLGSAADNYRAIYNKNWDNGDTTILAKYDIFRQNNATFTLKSANYGLMSFWDTNDVEHSQMLGDDDFVEVVRSRKTNQLNAVSAAQTSLTNPITVRRFPLFDAFNALTDSCFSYKNCIGEEKMAKFGYYNHKYYFFGDIIDKYCEIPIPVLLNVGNVKYVVSGATEGLGVPISQLYFTKDGDRVLVRRRDATASESISWNDKCGLFPECFDGILQASAVEFSSDWIYPYADVGAPSTLSENYLRVPNITRAKRANVFDTERKQTGYFPDYQTNIAWDGTFNFFNNLNFLRGNANNLQYPWSWTTEITKFSPFGYEIENRNALNIYESALYGYGNRLMTAVANNARYCEIAFDGFENDLPFSTSAARGHFLYIYNMSQPQPICTSEFAHTGRNSLCFNALVFQVQLTDDFDENTDLNGIVTLKRGKKYVFSCWVRKAACNTTENLGNNYYYRINGGNFVAIKPTEKIDCWQRLEFTFTAPSTPSPENTAIITIQDEDATPTPLRYYFDDLRLSPFSATMKTYIYTPENYRLVAEMDENNFATFYNKTTRFIFAIAFLLIFWIILGTRRTYNRGDTFGGLREVVNQCIALLISPFIRAWWRRFVRYGCRISMLICRKNWTEVTKLRTITV